SSVQTNRMVSGVEANREDVIRTARAVIPAARPALTDLDPRVRRQGLEVVRQAAVAVGELVQDPKKSDDVPPSGRPWSAMERMEVDEYRKEVEGMRSLVMPVAQALRDLAPSLREGLLDADPRNRLAASRALEEVGNSHMRLLRLTQSVPATQP